MGKVKLGHTRIHIVLSERQGRGSRHTRSHGSQSEAWGDGGGLILLQGWQAWVRMRGRGRQGPWPHAEGSQGSGWMLKWHRE